MIKTKLGTRMFSVLMVLTMLLSLLPMTAFAKSSKSSAVTLAEGTYTVTANLYVKAEDNKVLGINAYLTNTELPPINPVSENATLIVAANGEMTLKLNELNSIFTLQEIDGSNDAEIVNRTVTEDVQWPEGFEGEKKINSRISALEIKLKQGVDHYVFSNCKEYPTLLASSAELEGYWDVPLTLDIDFDSAYIPFDDKADGIQTYSINDNGVTVDVETSDEQMKSSMSNARLSASYTTENDTITSLLKEKYDSEPSYTAYTLSMNSKLVGNTRATITLPTSLTTAMHVYKLNDNDTLSEVGYYQWNSNTLNEGLLDRLETNGYRIRRVPISEMLLFMWVDNKKGSTSTVDTLTDMLKKIQHELADISTFSKSFNKLLVIAEANLHGFQGANGRYRYAKTIQIAYDYDAVLELAPRYENTAMVLDMCGLYQKAACPVYNLSLDGDWDETAESRLNSFLYYCKINNILLQ